MAERFPVEKTDEEWKKILTPEQYQILRGHATERPGTCALLTEKRPGTFSCAGCGQELFTNDTKFESGTGWPSFYDPYDEAHIRRITDTSYGMHRVEIRCARCDGHLGHVFPDGPPPSGERHCLNSASLEFFPDGEAPEPDHKPAA